MSVPSSSGTLERDVSSDSDFTSEPRLIDTLLSQVDGQSIENIIGIQTDSLRRFEKSNEMLSNCNHLSEKRLERTRKEMAAQRDVIIQMKADLEYIFKKIRFFKGTLAKKYPDIYSQVEAEFKAKNKGTILDDEEEDSGKKNEERTPEGAS